MEWIQKGGEMGGNWEEWRRETVIKIHYVIKETIFSKREN